MNAEQYQRMYAEAERKALVSQLQDERDARIQAENERNSAELNLNLWIGYAELARKFALAWKRAARMNKR
jgi:hypothetical protein